MKKRKLNAEEKNLLKNLASGKLVKATSTGPAEKVLQILMGVAAIILVLSMLFMVARVRDDYEGVFRRSDVEYVLRSGNYADLVHQYYSRHADTAGKGRVEKELAAFAEYIEAAFIYHAAQEAGNTEKAARYRARMEEALAASGQYAAEEKTILKRLGIPD